MIVYAARSAPDFIDFSLPFKVGLWNDFSLPFCCFVSLFIIIICFLLVLLLICGSFNDEASILDFRITNKIHDSVNMNNSNELTNDKKT